MLLALSVSEQVEKFGAYAGFAAVVGLAVLSLLYFAQARELKRLREWAGRAPERAAELEARAAEAAQKRVTAQPRPAAQPQPQQPQPTVASPAATPAGQRAAGANGAPGQPAKAPAGATTAAAAAAPAAPGAAAAPGAPPAGQPPKPGAPAGPQPPAAPGAKPPEQAPGAPPKPPVPGAPAAKEPAPAQPGTPAPAGDGATSPPAPPPATPAAAARPAPAQPLRAPQPTARSSAAPPPRRPTGRQADDIAAGGHPGRDDESHSPRATIAIAGGVAVLLAAVVFVGTQVFGGDDAPPPNTLGDQPATAPAPAGEGAGEGSTSASTTAQAVQPSEISVAVLNGTTTTGLARGVADRLESGGFAIGAVTNAADQSRSATIVQYAAGQRRAAMTVARQIGVGADAVSEVDAGARAFAPDEDVVVTVGADQNTAGSAQQSTG